VRLAGAQSIVCPVCKFVIEREETTVGRDEEQIRNYIREQEREDKRLDQLKMFD
jgi:hypothetical protein